MKKKRLSTVVDVFDSWSQLFEDGTLPPLEASTADLSRRIGCIKATIAMRFRLNWILSMQQLR